MKRTFFTGLMVGTLVFGGAQTTPMDFNRKDCNGVQRHLFGDLDSGYAVIIEYFMINCAPCPAAGGKLEAMKSSLLTQYPGKIKSYAIAYNNTYTQAQVKNWVASNGFNMIPMDSGALQVAYYGGMGMPTIVIAGGKTTHSVLGGPYVGFSNSDTTQMAADIRALLGAPTNTGNTVGIQPLSGAIRNFEVFPVPANDHLQVTFDLVPGTEYELALYDLSGREVRRLTKGITGRLVSSFPLSDIAAGNYMVQLKTAGGTRSRKITIIH